MYQMFVIQSAPIGQNGMTRFVSGEAEMEENPILKASLSMASDIPLYAQLTGKIGRAHV